MENKINQHTYLLIIAFGLNVVNCNEVYLKNTENSILHLLKNKGAVIKGLTNYIIVDDGHILLIYPKSEEQEIKQVAKNMATNFGERFT